VYHVFTFVAIETSPQVCDFLGINSPAGTIEPRMGMVINSWVVYLYSWGFELEYISFSADWIRLGHSQGRCHNSEERAAVPHSSHHGTTRFEFPGCVYSYQAW